MNRNKYQSRISEERQVFLLRSAEPFLPAVFVSGAGYSVWGAGGYLSTPSKPVTSINLITEGSVVFTQRGREMRVGQGGVLICHRGMDQCIRSGPEGYVCKRWVHLRGHFTDMMFAFSGLLDKDSIDCEPSHRLSHLFRRSYALVRSDAPGRAVTLGAIGYELIMALGKMISGEYPPAVRSAMYYMESAIDRFPSLDEVAHQVHVSSRHLTRLFNQSVKLSPLAWFTREKMYRALDLLTSTDVRVKDIALRLGYSTTANFSLAFKRFTGHSPRHYRCSGQKKCPV
jgi:AraC-like DNA-binding protein